MDSLDKLRRKYSRSSLKEEACPDVPIAMCKTWLAEAIEHRLQEPNAMILSTVTTTGQPSSRVVLLKAINETGFTFFTHYKSHKATDIAANPQVSLLFFWIALERQIRIEGQATRLSTQASDAYFATRPRDSQLSAWTSLQSSPIKDKSILEEEKKVYTARFKAHKNIPRPPNWGGYLVQPHTVEFWQGRADRLHDRICYKKTTHGNWKKHWLSP